MELWNPEGTARILCVVAHPDDMEYGASAAVSAWTRAGIEVGYVLVTDGAAGIRDRDPAEVKPLRRLEQEKACAAVGVEHLRILDFPDGMLEPGLGLRRAIAREIRSFRPEVVVTQDWRLAVPWGLNHVDHRVCVESVIDAIRDADNPWVFRELVTQEGLEPWKASTLLVTGAEATHAVEVSAEDVEAAVSSLAAHEIYLAALDWHPSPREIIEPGARTNGEKAGVEFAAGFAVYAV